MSKGIAVPGAVYSCLIAVGRLACLPQIGLQIILRRVTVPLPSSRLWSWQQCRFLVKMVTVQGSEPPAEALSRGMSTQPASKVNKFLLG